MAVLLNWWELSPELLCEMSWKHFDGFELNAFISQADGIDDLMAVADSCGMLVILGPADLHRLEHMGDTLCRAHYASLGGVSAFIEVDDHGSDIENYYTASATETLIEDICGDLVDYYGTFEDQVWFYRFFDEPASNQRKRQYDDDHDYDDYFPSYLTTDTTSFRADSAGTYSWLKRAFEQEDSLTITSTVFAGAQRIYSSNDWAGYFHPEPDAPTAHGRAEIIRGFCNMRYQPPDSGRVQNNFNDLVMVDIYPFRHVGTEYQDTASYTPALGDSLHTWLLDHMEEAMDSTFLAARESDCEVVFWPQAFGYAGGAGMWEEGDPDDWTIEYASYPYRIPTPAELRMHLNLALLRQAKGFLPYCLITYTEESDGEDIPKYTTGLVDFHMIPFDAPFEEWAYTGRPQDSLSYIRPDSIEPFISGFDPLYSGPGVPPGTSGEQRRQDFLEWKFSPYGRLWNVISDIFGDVAYMAPELAELYWYEGFEDAANIECADDTLEYMTPEIKVFRDGEDERSYLFYVNRNCRDSSDIFTISIRSDSLSFPSKLALDHSRRVIIPSEDTDAQHFFFDDTLEAGGARLVELIGSNTDADLRITATDILASISGESSYSSDFSYSVGDSIRILAEVFNLGTDSAASVAVTLLDVTGLPVIVLGRDTLDFDGLSTSGYTTDSDTASFLWVPGFSTVGIRSIKVVVTSVSGEPDTRDNSVIVPFLIRPSDYATAVNDDPWDMTEGGSSDWNTDDIGAVSDYWLFSAWTDSVSGMFEGALDSSITGNLLRGDIRLAIPSNSYFNSSKFCMLSLAGVCNNPMVQGTAGDCAIHIGFSDTTSTDINWANLSDATGGLGNGWDQWDVLGPVHLDSVFTGATSWTGNVIDEVWLSLRTGKIRPTASVDIRIGWVKLTE